jgi:hypothetical protein
VYEEEVKEDFDLDGGEFPKEESLKLFTAASVRAKESWADFKDGFRIAPRRISFSSFRNSFFGNGSAWRESKESGGGGVGQTLTSSSTP